MPPASSYRKRNSKRFHRLSLRLTLIVPFVMQIAAAVCLVAYFSFTTAQQTVNNLAGQLLERTDQLVVQHLDRFLEEAQVVNREVVDVLELNLIERNDLAKIGQFLWRKAKNHSTVSYINYGLSTGEFAGAGRYGNYSTVSISETSAKTQWKNFNYATDARGNRTTVLDVYPNYDPRKEAWYQDAVRLRKSTWSQVYPWDENKYVISLAAASPVYDQNGKLIGAIGTDLLLVQIQKFLQTLDFSPSGKIFIMERNGLMIASSSSEAPFTLVNHKAERIDARQSSEPAIRCTAKALEQQFGSFAAIQQHQAIELRIEGNRQFVQVMPWSDQHGLDWLVVTTVPESDFMAEVNRHAWFILLLCLGALGLTIAIGLMTSRRFMHPILRTIHAAEALSENNWQQQVPDSQIRELSQLAKAFNRMSRQLQQSFDQLAFIAYHDPLTGLSNRRAFQQVLEAAIAKRQHQPDYQFAVLFLDLDFFKLVNDSYGHLVGDQLLIAVTQRLQTCVRDTDSIARFGGDEFTILLDNIANPETPVEIAQRIIKMLQASFNLDDREVFVSTSIGIVPSVLMGNSAADVLRDADTALYLAKADGKATYKVFNQEMHKIAVERLQLDTDLRRALDRVEFVAYYQPIFNIVTTDLAGFEALIRWHHPMRGLIPPDQFIPLAEETGLITAVGQWILEQACQQMRLWQHEFHLDPALTMSVNISSKQILHPDFVSQLQKILQKTQLAPRSLKLEITESSVLSHEEITRIRFEQLKELGVQVSIDDFGTGYSSLSYLHRLPVHTLKIDRSFVSRMGAHGENLEVIEAIVMLAHRLGIEVVAEGVETVEQIEQLRVLRCTQAQGYLFSPPRPASDIAKQLIAPKFVPVLSNQTPLAHTEPLQDLTQEQQ